MHFLNKITTRGVCEKVVLYYIRYRLFVRMFGLLDLMYTPYEYLSDVKPLKPTNIYVHILYKKSGLMQGAMSSY